MTSTKIFIPAFFLVLVAIATTSFGQIKVASGIQGEIYDQFANDISNNTELNISNISSGGSLENVRLLMSDSVDIGFMQYDVLLYKELEQPGIKDKLKVFLPLYSEEIHLIAKVNSNIDGLKSLQGKRVGSGTKNSGTYVTSSFIKLKSGLKWIDVDISFEKSFGALLHDSIDAFFYVGAAPSNILKNLSSNLGEIIKLVPVIDDGLEKFYSVKTIEKGVYPWLKNDVKTFSIKSLLVVNNSSIDGKTAANLDELYSDLQDNLAGIQNNKFSHPKWKQVDFTSMKGVDWPVYREKYVTFDFWVNIIALLAVFLTLFQIYFIINKLWSRKHEKLVAESISISAMFISITINLFFAIRNMRDVAYPQFTANILWIFSSAISVLIGVGFWVSTNKGKSFWRMLKQALNMERKEAGDLAKSFFRPKGADKILEILERMAMVDEDLDEREKKFIQNFADNWDIDIDWDEIKKYSNETGDKYAKIREVMKEYLETNPDEDQVIQLRDVFKLLVSIDDVVTEGEQMILDELEGHISEYLHSDEEIEMYRVAVVPQSVEKENSIKSVMRELKKERIAGGYAYLSDCYYSERYAEMLSAQYRGFGIFSVVIKPKHIHDDDDFSKMVKESSLES